MSELNLTYELASVGYLIVINRAGQFAEQSQGNLQTPSYCGVDRLPPFIAPEPEIRGLLGVPPIKDERFFDLVTEWFDARSAASAFIVSYAVAARLFERFTSFGMPFELLHCQLAYSRRDHCRLDSYSVTEAYSPTVSIRHGFDISWPSCNHSIIRQPGVVPTSKRWQSKLNQYGLLNNYEDAVMLRDEYLEVYPYPPFDIFLVHKVS